MKRMICMLVLFSLLVSGCGILGSRIKDPVTFYYIREDYQKDMGPVIAAEDRETSGRERDLPYLLALYSMGPSTEGLRSPFPRSTRITLTEHTEAGIVLNLSEPHQAVSDAEFTLAAACLAMTCTELSDTTRVTVVCGDRTVTIEPENLLL